MKKVAIIGGGFAGSYVARELEKKFDVTLIDTKNYFEFTPSVLRIIVEPERIKKFQSLHEHYLHHAKIIIGRVKGINSKEVFLGKGKIPFDYLVICSGSRYELPMKEQDLVRATRVSHLRGYNKKVCAAKKILLVGGGIEGVELAAEISTHFKDKEVLIVHSHDRLIERAPEKVGRIAERYLKSKGVEIIFGERVLKKVGKNYVTEKGKKISADLAFLCIGVKPNSEFMTGEMKESLQGNHVLVNDFLQVKGFKNIFSAGDVNSIRIEKTAQNAEHQAEVVVENILALESGEKLLEYSHKKSPMVISLGESNGIFISGTTVLSGFVFGWLKRIIEWKEMRAYK